METSNDGMIQALKKQDTQTVIFMPGDRHWLAGIERAVVEYEFIRNKLCIYPQVFGVGWGIWVVGVYDLSRHINQMSKIEEVMWDEYAKGVAYWRQEVKQTKPPYSFICPIAKNFGGKIMAIVLGFSHEKKKHTGLYQGFIFFQQGFRFVPTITWIFGFGVTLSVARVGEKYLVPKKWNTFRLPDGRFVVVGETDKAPELNPEQLKFLSFMDFLSPVKQIWKPEEKIGKEYLDAIFKKLEESKKEKKPEIVDTRMCNSLVFPAYYEAMQLATFLLPSPRENFTRSRKAFDKFLYGELDDPETWSGLLGWLGFGIMTVLDFVPASKTIKKVDTILEKKILKKFDEVPHYLGKSVDEALQKTDEGIELAERIKAKKKLSPEFEATVDKNLEKLQATRGRLLEVKKMLSSGSLPLKNDGGRALVFQETKANRDARVLVRYMHDAGDPLSLRQICQVTKGWGPRRRWKAFEEWLRVEMMGGKKIPRVRLSEEADRLLIEEAEDFTQLGHFNPDQNGFQRILKKIEKGVEHISGTGLNRVEINKFREALQEAWARLAREHPEMLPHVQGMEFSGKSSSLFSGSSIEYLDDIDGSIIGTRGIDLPHVTPAAYKEALKAKKQFFDYLDEIFGEKIGFRGRRGNALKSKNIFIYGEFGKGAFNKKTEGYPKKFRSIYDHVEQRGAIRFDPATGALKPIDRLPPVSLPPTPEEVESFCWWALEQFTKEKEIKKKKVKWILKVHSANGFIGKTKSYSHRDRRIVKNMGIIYVRDRNKILESERILAEEAENFLRKYAGDPNLSLKPEMHMFVFKNKTEAQNAYALVNSSKLAARVRARSRIFYAEKELETPNKPPIRTVKLYPDPNR